MYFPYQLQWYNNICNSEQRNTPPSYNWQLGIWFPLKAAKQQPPPNLIIQLNDWNLWEKDFIIRIYFRSDTYCKNSNPNEFILNFWPAVRQKPEIQKNCIGYVSDSTMEYAEIKNVPVFVYCINTVICLLDNILRFLVCWLGPWPVIWVFRVQIPPKSLITYSFTEIFKNWLFLFLSNPTLDSQYRAN